MLFGAMNALGLETHLAADQGVVRVAVGTVVGASDEHVVEQGPPGDEFWSLLLWSWHLVGYLEHQVCYISILSLLLTINFTAYLFKSQYCKKVDTILNA